MKPNILFVIPTERKNEMVEFVHAICDACFAEVDAPISIVRESVAVRGMPVTEDFEYPICPECGNRIGHAPTMDRNLEKQYRRYRDLRDIPQPEEIVALRKRYGFTQRAFAAVLDMGIASVQRYEHGALPTAAHAHLLRNMRDPRYARERLLGNRKKLGSDEVDKALSAIEGCLGGSVDYAFVRIELLDGMASCASPETGMRSLEAARLRETVVFLASHVRDLYRTKLNKVLFYLDFASFRDAGVSFTGLKYAKAEFGPVPDQYELMLAALTDGVDLSLLEQGEGQVVVSNRPSDLAGFSADEIELLKAVCAFANTFASSADLSHFSHGETGWLETPLGQIIDYSYAASLRWKCK